MPTTYAHYIFGDEVLNILPVEYQNIIKRHRNIYDFGVHGPDIFFYYYGYKSNDITNFGYTMHLEAAKIFFTRAKEVYKTHEEKEMMMAYILGFLTHFTFDSFAHSYIERKREYAGISHNKVEAEYDRHLIVKNGYAPNKYNRAQSLKPNKDIARVISYFFNFDEKTIYTTLKWQVLILNTLHCGSKVKRQFLDKSMDLLKVDSEIKDLVIGEYEDPVCADSNLRIDKIKVKALEYYPTLFNNLINYFDDKEELIDFFDHHFEKWPNYNELPVLSYEEELKYNI